jgi:hypothetical protein
MELLRGRERAWSRLLAPVTAGAVTAAHLVLFVLPQDTVTGPVDWQGFYPPRDSLVASALHLWPFGLARVNYFLLPFVYLLAGVGLVYVLGWVRRARRPWRGYLAVALTVATVATCVALLGTAWAQLTQARRTARGPVDQLHMADIVAWTRLRASAGDVVGHYSGSGAKGWACYMRFYHGYDRITSAATRIGPERTLVLPGAADPSPLRESLARDRMVGEVFLVLPINARPDRLAAIERVLSASGYRRDGRTAAWLTSSVQRLTRRAG